MAGSSLEIIDCAGWKARVVDTSALSRLPAFGVTIHHTAGANVIPHQSAAKERARCCALARSIQASHQANGWIDSGQHFLVTRSGLILEGRHGSLSAAERGLVVHGAHAGEDFANTKTFGIESEGNTNDEPLASKQFAALIDLVAWLAWKGNFDTRNVFPHKHFKATACPGDWLTAKIDTLAAAAHEAKLALLAP